MSIMKKLVGTVTNEEKCEIQTLFERRNGLNELAGILTVDNEVLYEKLVKDNKDNSGLVGSYVKSISMGKYRKW